MGATYTESRSREGGETMGQNTLGGILTRQRKVKNMTQQELAEQMNVTAAAVSKWERDQSLPDIYTLSRLADLFGVTLDELLGKHTDTPVEVPSRTTPRFGKLIWFFWVLAGVEALSIVIISLTGLRSYWVLGVPNLGLKVGIALTAELLALFLLTRRERQ
jgi:transcriptional regulator with XRE-family HTH domain